MSKRTSDRVVRVFTGMLIVVAWVTWIAAPADAQAPAQPPVQTPTTNPATPSVAPVGPMGPAAPAECFPSCRAGFVCHQGQCISACNPVCENGLLCSPQGTCVSPCNPACPAGQACMTDGSCVAFAPMTTAQSPVAPAAANPSATPAIDPSSGASVSATADAGGAVENMNPPRSRVMFDMTFFSGVARAEFVETDGSTTERDVFSVTAFAPALRGRFVRRQLIIDADLPFAAGGIEFAEDIELVPGAERSSSAFVIGNPNVSVGGWLPIAKGRGWISLGGGFALPLASVEDDPDSMDEANDGLAKRLALGSAAAMAGTWNAWRYLPNYGTLYFPMEIESGSERVRFGGELTFARMFYTGDADISGASVLQFGARLQGKLSSAAWFGVRWRGVFADESGSDVDDDDDKFQMSLEPFIEALAGQRVVLGAGFLFNLDEPNGIVSDELFVWGARVSLGANL